MRLARYGRSTGFTLAKPSEHTEVSPWLRRVARWRSFALLVQCHSDATPSPGLDQAARFQDHHDDEPQSEEEPSPKREIHCRQGLYPKKAAEPSGPMGELSEKYPVKERDY